MNRDQARIGFHFHPESVLRHFRWTTVFLFLFVMFLVPAIPHVSNLAKSGIQDPRAWSLIGCLILSLVAASYFFMRVVRFLRGQPVLEFRTSAMIDRSRFRERVIPFEKIVSFTPTLQELFQPDLALQAVGNELEINDFRMFSCQLKAEHGLKIPGMKNNRYVFAMKTRPFTVTGANSAPELEAAVRKLLASHVEKEMPITHFQSLYD